MFTRPPAATLATTVNIDGMDFERIEEISNGVDRSGLLVAKTLLTQSQAAHAVDRLQALRKSERPLTHGQITMHSRSGDADVTGWGYGVNATKIHRYPLRLVGQDLSWGEGRDATLRTGLTGKLFPTDLLTVQPGFENHPAAVTWITSVALAAAKTEADAHYLVRLMHRRECAALLKYVYGDMSEQDIKAMSVLCRGGITGPVSVVGSEADKRTRKGITDAFGHMLNWLNDLYGTSMLTQEGVDFRTLSRLWFGSEWGEEPECVDVDYYGCEEANYFSSIFGVRLVAVPRLPC